MQENHKTKLVLFDLDGTLIDTAPDFLVSLNNVLKNHDTSCVSMDEVRPHISEGTSKLIKLFLLETIFPIQKLYCIFLMFIN